MINANMNICETKVCFIANETQYEFFAYHNLSDFGINIGDAVHNWIARADNFTDNSFCDYVKRKDSNIVCLTQSEFKKASILESK